MKKFEMATCVKSWPSKTQNELIFYNKDAPHHDGKTGYVDAFRPKIMKLRKEAAMFISKSPRYSKTECSLRFCCKICQKDFVFKAAKSVCVAGRDVKWTLVPPTDLTCKCFLEGIVVDGEEDEETMNIDDDSQELLDTPSKELDELGGSQPAAHGTPALASKIPKAEKLRQDSASKKTPSQPSTETKINVGQQNTPKQLKVLQLTSKTPKRLFVNDGHEVQDALKDLSLLIEKLPKKQALETINIATCYGSNLVDFLQRSKQNPKEGSPDTICDKMTTSLCRTISLKITRYNSKNKTTDMKGILGKAEDKETGSGIDLNISASQGAKSKGVEVGKAGSGSNHETPAPQSATTNEVQQESETEVTSGKRQSEQEENKENSNKKQKTFGMVLRKSHELIPPNREIKD